jgi:hypothetical protein
VINIKLEPGDESAVITSKNGAIQKQEFYYGSSFLSQSARFLTLNSNVASVEITNNKGQKRSLHFDQRVASQNIISKIHK